MHSLFLLVETKLRSRACFDWTAVFVKANLLDFRTRQVLILEWSVPMRTTGCENGSLFRSPWAMTADMFHFRCQLQRIEDQKEKCRNKKKKKEKATRRKQTTPIFSTEQKTVMTFFLVKIEDLLKNILVRFFLYNKIKAFFF